MDTTIGKQTATELIEIYEQIIRGIPNLGCLCIAIGIADFFASMPKGMLEKWSKNQQPNQVQTFGQISILLDYFHFIETEGTSIIFVIDPELKQSKTLESTFSGIKKLQEDPLVYEVTLSSSSNILFFVVPYALPTNYSKTSKKTTSLLHQINATKLKPYQMADLCIPKKDSAFHSLFKIASDFPFTSILVMNAAWMRTYFAGKYFYINKYFENMCELFYLLKYSGKKNVYLLDASFYGTHRGATFETIPDQVLQGSKERFVIYLFNNELVFNPMPKNIENSASNYINDFENIWVNTQGGKRRTIKRNQKKRSRKNRK